jgi:hypothetical protein
LDAGVSDSLKTFIDLYPLVHFVISSRYTTFANSFHFKRIEIAAWDKQRVRNYLIGRVGESLGTKMVRNLGQNVDFEWLNTTSIAGFSTSPITLWILATLVESKKEIPKHEDNIVEAVVDLLIGRLSIESRLQMPAEYIKAILSEFAYSMVENGLVLSTEYAKGLEITASMIKKPVGEYILPTNIDAYGLLSLLERTGCIRIENERIEWFHQVIQEDLSIWHSKKRFSKANLISNSLMCPHCSYLPEGYAEQADHIYAICQTTHKRYKTTLSLPPSHQIFRRFIKFMDGTGAPHDEGMINIPHAFMDEGTIRLPAASHLYVFALMYSQRETGRFIAREDLQKQVDYPNLVFDIATWLLVESGLLELEHQRKRTIATVLAPPINPSARILGLKLVTLREMSPVELEETAEERMGITTKEKENWLEEQRKKNLPVPHIYSFGMKERSRLFRIAQKYGGQVRREWGPYEEVIAEFPGDAWDFTGYATDHIDR